VRPAWSRATAVTSLAAADTVVVHRTGRDVDVPVAPAVDATALDVAGRFFAGVLACVVVAATRPAAGAEAARTTACGRGDCGECAEAMV